MNPVHVIPSVVFVLSWLGAFGAWSMGAYSLVRLFTDGSRDAIEGHRGRATRAFALSVTFVVTGFLSAIASGALTQLHV